MFFKNRIADGIPLKLPKMHGKNGFAEVFKNLARYRFENNFVCTIKIIVQDSNCKNFLQFCHHVQAFYIIILMVHQNYFQICI